MVAATSYVSAFFYNTVCSKHAGEGSWKSQSAGPAGCGSGDGYLLGSPTPDGDAIDGRLFFSTTTGKLVAIYAFPGVKTAQGVQIGSSYAQMHAAYPTWESITGDGSTNGRGGAPAPGNPGAHFRIVVLNDKVFELSLDSKAQDCYE